MVAVPLTLGSDWPVTSLQVATGIEAAVNRTAWAPGLRNQALTLLETLAGYTVTPAWVEFREHDKGRLRPGMRVLFLGTSAGVSFGGLALEV